MTDVRFYIANDFIPLDGIRQWNNRICIMHCVYTDAFKISICDLRETVV